VSTAKPVTLLQTAGEKTLIDELRDDGRERDEHRGEEDEYDEHDDEPALPRSDETSVDSAFGSVGLAVPRHARLKSVQHRS
jgi:hypothetical protein